MLNVNHLKYTTEYSGVTELNDVDPLTAVEALFVALDEDRQAHFLEKYGTGIQNKTIDDVIDIIRKRVGHTLDAIDLEQAIRERLGADK